MDLETGSFLFFFLACKARFRWMSGAGIRRYQEKKARRIAQYAVRHSKYFRELYDGFDLDDVWSLPTTDKRTMMENLTDYNTVGFTKEELLRFCAEVEQSRDFGKRLWGMNIGMSSGTSGNKGVIITTPREEKYLKAAFFARFAFPGGEKLNLAFILRVSTPAFNINRFGHRLTYISQLNRVEAMVERLHRVEPNVISAPPSMLRILAKEAREGRLSVRPKLLVSYAEILYPEVKRELEEVFGCPVHQIYQCSEGAIAISCKEGSLHINEDLMAVQTLDADGEPTPPGVPCHKMIVTDLHKTSQPVIRFELNDIITISENRCGCGSAFRVIEEVQGRADDLFWARRVDDGEWQFIFPDYIRRAIIGSSDEIEEYQAVQGSPDGVLVRLVMAVGADEGGIRAEVAESIRGVFAAYGCREPAVRVAFEEPRRNAASLKLIRIRRDFEL